ncbi:MAG: ABC transporter permease [Myxococcales bacterium]|nr:MAG: ABC transporter permease [Myxococcales bacterium]
MHELPSGYPAIQTVAELHWLKLKRGKGLWLGIIATLTVIVAVALARYAAKDIEPSELMQSALSLDFFGLLVYLLPFLFAAGAISDEVEDRTFSFIISRPVRRVYLLLGKFLSASLASIALLCLSTLCLHLIIYLPDFSAASAALPQSLAAMGSLSILASAYCAICLLWGALAVEASGVLSVMYFAVVEFSLGHILPGPSRMVSLNYHAKQLAGLPKGGLFAPEMTPDLPAVAHAGVLCAALLVVMLLCTLVINHGEYVTEQS